jgi:hypothetical protein
MAFFVCIGPHKSNISKFTSKGYSAKRIGTSIIIEFGAIIINKRKYYWAGKGLPFKKIYKFKNIQEADLFKEKLWNRKESGKYIRLHNQIIYKYKLTQN